MVLLRVELLVEKMVVDLVSFTEALKVESWAVGLAV
jgi:hypothetical protein